MRTDASIRVATEACAGYKRFFKRIDPTVRIMADLVGQGRYAAKIMKMDLSVNRPSDDD